MSFNDKPNISLPLPSPPSSHNHEHDSSLEKRRDEARITFDKTISGHYSNGKTGYRQVGVLFLTWKDDDMHCSAEVQM